MDQSTILSIQGLKLLYDRDLGLKHLDLQLPEGAVYGFLGRNGAGKSTTLQILAGVLKPQAGKIRFLGEESTQITKDWKHLIGYVPQEPVFPAQSTGKSIQSLLSKLYKAWDQKKFTSLCQRFQLSLDQEVTKYSVGMKKMLAISIAYAINPRVYVLDEPTAGLDLIARKIMLDLLAEESEKGKSAILSTHIVDDVYGNCSHLGMIHFGQSLMEGPIDQFGSSAKEIESSYLDLIKTNFRDVE